MIKNFLLLIAFVLLGTSCQRTDHVEELLQDENERRKVYTTILNNEEMRNEMMGMMRERNMSGMVGRGGMMHGEDMMTDSVGMADVNRQQMQTWMQEMMTLCQTDTAACTMMSQMMMRHHGMMTSMMQHMQQRGMMDSACLQQMRRQFNR